MDQEINESILNDEIKDVLEKERSDYMEYLPDMEVLEDSSVMEQVLSAMEQYDYNQYTKQDVEMALNKESIGPKEFEILLSPVAEDYLEEMAQRALLETKKHFGNNVYLFTPLYISNYCENYCIYCGFHCHNQIKRARLDKEGMEREMEVIAQSGLEEILILTGESRNMSDVEYIGEACKIAKKYFKMVGLEVYPMNTDEYAYLQKCGADYVTVFQETYNGEKYEKLHLAGHKRVFPYRFHAQERALRGGMRGVAFAALLGLDDFRKDAFATGMHAYLLQRKYPHAEISFSCPRLRPIVNNDKIHSMDVHETQLLQVMLAYRLFMPFAGMTISTRERAEFRDNVIGLVATKISAAVSTGIGSHAEEQEQGDEQFEIADGRNVEEVVAAIKARGLWPVMNDYVYV